MGGQGWSAAVALSAAVACTAFGCERGPSREPDAPPASAATVEAMVPVGWEIEQRHDADFNGDGRSDALLLLRRAASAGTIPERSLVIGLATASPPGYKLHSSNARLVPSDPSGRVEDPMANGGITVRPGGFDLTLGMTVGVGSYQAATLRYRFRLEPECFRLIGFDRAETHRGTLETRDVSVNFLTGVVVHTAGNARSAAAETRRERLTNPRWCLPDLPSAWTFDPLSR